MFRGFYLDYDYAGRFDMEVLEAYIRLVEGITRIREATRASWFSLGGSSAVVFIEAYAPLEYGSGSGVYRGYGFLGKLLEGETVRGAYVYLPLLRLSEPVIDDEASMLYYSLMAGVIAELPSGLEGFEKIYVELVEGRLIRPVKRSWYLLEPLLSTRLQRLYDATSTVRDCKGSLKVELNGTEVSAYTLPAFVKCLATGKLANTQSISDVRELARKLEVRDMSPAEASATLAIVEKHGILILRHPLYLLFANEEYEEDGGKEVEPARDTGGGAAAGI